MMRLRPTSTVGSHSVDVEVRGECSDADLALIQRLAEAQDTRPVVVRRVRVRGLRLSS
jgi:hypothetical protein